MADIPNAPWEPIFFGSIDALSKQASWVPLRKMDIPSGSIEVRVWAGFGLSPLQGIRLRRIKGHWLGYEVKEEFDEKLPVKVCAIRPRMGWDKLWEKIVAQGVLILPDSSTLPQEHLVFDGISYVVEFNDGAHYRTYQYGNPEHQDWPEAKKIISIVDLLYDELLR